MCLRVCGRLKPEHGGLRPGTPTSRPTYCRGEKETGGMVRCSHRLSAPRHLPAVAQGGRRATAARKVGLVYQAGIIPPRLPAGEECTTHWQQPPSDQHVHHPPSLLTICEARAALLVRRTPSDVMLRVLRAAPPPC